ncbi:MAG: DUF2272 domain-containing protein [Pirellulaceae bacterium]
MANRLLNRQRELVRPSSRFVAKHFKTQAHVRTPAQRQMSSETNVDDDIHELEDGTVHLAQSMTVSAHCPINRAADASSAHFALAEFHCRDGTQVPEDLRGNVQEVMDNLEVLRGELGEPITVNSGYRSPSYNTRIGGAERSQHLCGRAADIKVKNFTPRQVHAKIEELIGSGRMRQGGLGLYNTFVHYDVRGTRARWDNSSGATTAPAATQSYYARSSTAPERTQTHTISAEGIALIKEFEGFRGELYNDSAGHCTIGYGHLVHRGNCNGSESEEFRTGISEARATELLHEKLLEFERTVNESVTAAMNSNQFDALVSFCYNIGSGAFKGSTLLKKLNNGEYDKVPEELKKWNKAGGKVLKGLVNRRKKEAELFEKPVTPPGASTAESLTWPGAATLSRNASLAERFAAVGLNFADFELRNRSQGMQAAPAAIDWCQIRHNMIRMAVEMQGEWLLPGGGLMDESHANARQHLIAFWRDGVGLSQANAVTAAAQSAANRNPPELYTFWSAAFICWCVRQSMPTPPPPHNGGFVYHLRHMAYIAQAARNVGDNTRPFWLFDINDPNVVPEHGDILCLNFDSSHTFNSIHEEWVVRKPSEVATGHSHGDIVIGHFEDNGQRWIETIGGNVGNTVGSRRYSVDANGRLIDEIQRGGAVVHRNVTQGNPARVFGVIKLTTCPNL